MGPHRLSAAPRRGSPVPAPTGAVRPDSTGPLCAGTDPSLFFPDRPSDESRADECKRLCVACRVRLSCLTDAIRFDAAEGFWGGYTARERRHLSAETLKSRDASVRLAERIATGHGDTVGARERPTVVMELRRRGWDEARTANTLKLSSVAVRDALQAQRDIEFFSRARELARRTAEEGMS
ncbi:WhiB family transcriptional regulator [Streptomyces zaomyceticus]|uniref:WhiB family transcriptional regulator n=1 Tax=Streptomyces zaomyceticus TaxID=68286 RepID=UPI003689213F